jgi:hypothetical protein
MQKFVAEQNIHHFKDLLARETDPRQRQLLQLMIDEEEAKLEARRREERAPKAAE